MCKTSTKAREGSEGGVNKTGSGGVFGNQRMSNRRENFTQKKEGESVEMRKRSTVSSRGTAIARKKGATNQKKGGSNLDSRLRQYNLRESEVKKLYKRKGEMKIYTKGKRVQYWGRTRGWGSSLEKEHEVPKRMKRGAKKEG